MLESHLYLGFDTSAYTTSLAAMVDDRVWQFKKVLDVRLGECGLRQSEALFQHIKNFPLLFEELCKQVPVHDFKNVTVSVSNAPRNIEKSYMPVFLAGQNFGKTIAAALDAEYKEFSHQEGHIMAGIYSSKADILNEPFFAFHLSGGTTELLLVDKSDVSGRLNTKIIGKTLDISAGQFIDRIGIKMGFGFPAGKFLDDIAMENFKNESVKVSAKDFLINFSGAETKYERELEKNISSGDVSNSVMQCICKTILSVIKQAKNKYNIANVLMVGGVCSSRYLHKLMENEEGIYFASPSLSTDNAVGICILGKGI